MRFVLIFASSLASIIASVACADDGTILERKMLDDGASTEVVVERLIYESDGLRIMGYLAYPRSAPDAEKPLPCLLFNRGGNRDFGMWNPDRFADFVKRASDWGYVLFASNYRGSSGSQGADEFGGADVNDVINAIKVFDQLSFADGKRIGMWGHSRGGMMTYLALTRTNRIAAAIVGAGVSDMGRMIKLRPRIGTSVLAECVPDWETKQQEAIQSRSAVNWADLLPSNVPILLVHGTADWRVTPRDSLDMAAAMLEANRPYRLIMFEGADHAISEFREEYDDATRMWLDDYVRNAKTLPNLEPHGT